MPAATLNVAPMIRALEFYPGDFEYAHGRLTHIPSRHQFRFDSAGRVAVDAVCGCSSLAVAPEQSDEFFAAFTHWRANHWMPLEINREFVSHFAEPSALVRLFRDVRTAFRRFGRSARDRGLVVTTGAERAC